MKGRALLWIDRVVSQTKTNFSQSTRQTKANTMDLANYTCLKQHHERYKCKSKDRECTHNTTYDLSTFVNTDAKLWKLIMYIIYH